MRTGAYTNHAHHRDWARECNDPRLFVHASCIYCVLWRSSLCYTLSVQLARCGFSLYAYILGSILQAGMHRARACMHACIHEAARMDDDARRDTATTRCTQVRTQFAERQWFGLGVIYHIFSASNVFVSCLGLLSCAAISYQPKRLRARRVKFKFISTVLISRSSLGAETNLEHIQNIYICYILQYSRGTVMNRFG